MRILLLCALMLATLPAGAQQQSGPPKAFLEKMPGHGTNKPLIIGYCLIGSHLCAERLALAWGQVCDSMIADDMGNGRSGQIDGRVPWGLHYAGWRCGWNGRWHDKSERVFGGGGAWAN